MRYENPLHMAGEAAAADLLSSGRLQLGISRGSPEPAVDGQAAYGYVLEPGETWAGETRRRAARFREAIAGVPMARSEAAARHGADPDLPVRPQSPGLINRIWWGAGTHATGIWAGEEGMNLVSSTLLLGDDGRPFHVQQADQVRAYREAYAQSGHTTGGMAAVTRSVFPIVDSTDRRYFAREDEASDGTGWLDGSVARSGPTIAGIPEVVAGRLAADEAVQEADYVLFALPSHLGVEYNAHLLRSLAEVATEIGWTKSSVRVA